MIRTASIILMFMQTSVLIAQEGMVYSIQWRIGGSIPAASGESKQLGLAGAVVGKSNRFLIVAGGCNFPDSMPWLGGKKRYYSDAFVFVKSSDDNFQLHTTTQLPFNIAYASSCTTPNGIVFAGGENENGINQKAYLLQWEETIRNIKIESLPDLPSPLTNGSIASIKNKVYFAGGESASLVSDKFFVLDLNDIAKGWVELPPVPVPLSHAVISILSDSKTEYIYLIGGRKKRTDSVSQFYSTNFKFDLKQKKWSKQNPLPYAVSAGTGIAWDSKYILLIGGDQGKTFQHTEELILAISKESNEEQKKQMINDKTKLQSSHPGFSRQVLLYNSISDKWISLDSVTMPVPVTTTALKWDNSIVVPGGEIKAGVRSANILIGEVKNINKRK